MHRAQGSQITRSMGRNIDHIIYQIKVRCFVDDNTIILPRKFLKHIALPKTNNKILHYCLESCTLKARTLHNYGAQGSKSLAIFEKSAFISET